MKINFIAILWFIKPLFFYAKDSAKSPTKVIIMLGSVGLIQELNEKFKVKFGYGSKANAAAMEQLAKHFRSKQYV